jgi:hypothetical protein
LVPFCQLTIVWRKKELYLFRWRGMGTAIPQGPKGSMNVKIVDDGSEAEAINMKRCNFLIQAAYTVMARNPALAAWHL